MRIDLIETYETLNKGVRKIDPIDNWKVKPCLAFLYKDHLQIGYTCKINGVDYYAFRYINLWALERCTVTPEWLLKEEVKLLVNSVVWDLTNNYSLYTTQRNNVRDHYV